MKTNTTITKEMCKERGNGTERRTKMTSEGKEKRNKRKRNRD